MMRRWTGALALFALACGGPSPAVEDGGHRHDAAQHDAGPPVERGPAVLAIEGDANGLFWDTSSGSLLVADDDGNRIVRWRDEGGFSLVSELPAGTDEGAGLGQLVRTSDGAIVVTRFGCGTRGDVAVVPPEGAPYVVPGLDPMRRRIGLTLAPDGRLFDSWFVRVASGDRVGAVGALSLDGTETEAITGLQKPVGVLAMGDSLYVTDQDLGEVLRAPLTDLSSFVVHAEIDQPDLLAAGPGGSLFTGGLGGVVYQVGADGAVAIVGTGFSAVRGVAYDAQNRRLFVAEHDADEEHAIHILPID